MLYRVSRDAEADLDQIFEYWSGRVSIELAERIIDAIADRFHLLASYPNVGRVVRRIGPGIRCFPSGKYLIYFRKTKFGVEILHIFHGARDQKRALRKSRNR
jgi:toxin ParE1/3/4